VPAPNETDITLTLRADQLKEIIGRVAFAAADDDSRPGLTGMQVCFHGALQQATFACADAFRLVEIKIELALPSDLDLVLLIPAKNLRELARILPSTEEEVRIVASAQRGQVLFETANIDFASRLIDAPYPNYRQIIPAEYQTRAVVETKELLAALKSIMPFARDASHIARVRLGEGSCTLDASSEDVGSNVSTIAASVDGPEQLLTLNARYLAEALSVIDAPETALEVLSSARPCVLRPVGMQGYSSLIMPMSGTNR
jgi:DNA polymerase-3 subunit beta